MNEYDCDYILKNYYKNVCEEVDEKIIHDENRRNSNNAVNKPNPNAHIFFTHTLPRMYLLNC